MAFAVGLFLFIYGKTHSFVLINGYYNKQMDLFFQYVTFLGDGLIYIPIVLYCIFFNRQFILPVLFAIIICTALTHFFKRVVFPDELRPISLELENIIIRKVEGVPPHRLHSFPSGHTSTAFSMALLLVTILKRKIWAFVLPLIAFLVGYSRVYLAQHFVTDVLAGMGIGIVTTFLSLWLYKLYLKRKAEKQQQQQLANE
jgi:membrane-associated phospholipid phosphatase